MTTVEEKRSEFLFVPIIAALLLIGVAALLVWTTQVRPTTQPTGQTAQVSQSMPAEVAQTQAGNPTLGQQLYTGTCAACHGPNGQGVQGLGKDMTASQFTAGLSDAELIAFIKVGRDPSDPLNTTGVGMPAKGGNPALSDEDLQDIVAYIRTLQK